MRLEETLIKLTPFYTQIQAKQNYFLEDISQQIYINNLIFKPLV